MLFHFHAGGILLLLVMSRRFLFYQVHAAFGALAGFVAGEVGMHRTGVNKGRLFGTPSIHHQFGIALWAFTGLIAANFRMHWTGVHHVLSRILSTCFVLGEKAGGGDENGGGQSNYLVHDFSFDNK